MLQARAVEMAQGLYILALTCRRGALNKIPALTGFSSPPHPHPRCKMQVVLRSARSQWLGRRWAELPTRPTGLTPGDFVRAQKNGSGYSVQSDAQRQTHGP